MLQYLRRILLIPVLTIVWIFGPFFVLLDWLIQMAPPRETWDDLVWFTKNAWQSK